MHPAGDDYLSEDNKELRATESKDTVLTRNLNVVHLPVLCVRPCRQIVPSGCHAWLGSATFSFEDLSIW